MEEDGAIGGTAHGRRGLGALHGESGARGARAEEPRRDRRRWQAGAGARSRARSGVFQLALGGTGRGRGKRGVGVGWAEPRESFAN